MINLYLRSHQATNEKRLPTNKFMKLAPSVASSRKSSSQRPNAYLLLIANDLILLQAIRFNAATRDLSMTTTYSHNRSKDTCHTLPTVFRLGTVYIINRQLNRKCLLMEIIWISTSSLGLSLPKLNKSKTAERIVSM